MLGDRDDDLETRSNTVLKLANSLSISSIDHVILLPAPDTAATDFLADALTYLETPPYMRSRLFIPGAKSIDPKLSYLASLPEAETTLPHHNRIPADSLYRDGVTLRAEHWQTKHRLVTVGLTDGILASIPEAFPKRVRLAVRLSSLTPAEGERSIQAWIVSPTEAREELGQYMGYTISRTPSLSAMFEECPFEGGYDLSILLSDAGATDPKPLLEKETLAAMNYLVVMSTAKKLGELKDSDKQLQELGIENAADLFDHALNLATIEGGSKVFKKVDKMVAAGLDTLDEFLAKRSG